MTGLKMTNHNFNKLLEDAENLKKELKNFTPT